MSTTTTSAATTSATCKPASINILPTNDAACAFPATASNATDIADKCCSPATVHHYADDCGLYCLAQDQDLGDLLNCLTSNGVRHGQVICNDRLNATATGTDTDTATPSKTKNGDEGAEATSTSSEAAAAGNVRISKGGMGVLGVLLGSVLLGAF